MNFYRYRNRVNDKPLGSFTHDYYKVSGRKGHKDDTTHQFI